MQGLRTLFLVFCVVLLSFSLMGCPSQQAKGPKVFPQDKAPKTIDVSKYPKERQEQYALFQQKCGKCHDLSRALYAKVATDAELNERLAKMKQATGWNIPEDELAKLLDFYKWDHEQRKAEIEKWWQENVKE